MTIATFRRVLTFVSCLGLAAASCSNAEEEGRKAAKKRAKEAEAAKVATVKPAEKLQPPVPGMQNVACQTLINTETWTSTIGEAEPVTVGTATKSDAEAAAVCDVLRGGVRPSPSEQKAMAAKSQKLGVMAGDPICRITAYCWTIEEAAAFEQRCRDDKDDQTGPDDGMGSFACRKVVPTGADDVHSYKFFDPDTKCLINAAGGPSMVDNGVILNCAKAARDLIGADNIVPGEPAPKAAAGSGSASAE